MHHTEILPDQEKREFHLCDQCAAAQNLGPGVEIMGILSGAFPDPAEAAPEAPGLVCDSCELDYSEFRSTGRLGCPRCYDAFAEHLDPLLEKIHGQRHHVGKTPGESSAEERSRDRRLVDLRRRLQALVREENYEEAALVRDELNRLEEEGHTLDANG